MDINLQDEIVILDEAHNMEDSAREAGSSAITKIQLEETTDDLQQLIREQVMVDEHNTLKLLCSLLLQWIENNSKYLETRGFENSGKVWTGREMVDMLNGLNITTLTFKLFREKYDKILENDSDTSMDSRDMPKLTSRSVSFLRSLFMVLGFLFNVDEKYKDDYRIAVSKTATQSQRPMHLPGGWRRKGTVMEKVWTVTVNLWCLNPAVVFSQIGAQTRCIVLSSGTLSPMDSFSSELGVKFPIQLEANHVIPDKQTWVGALSVGPRGTPLNASYKTSENFDFKDDVGKLVLSVCQGVSGGVLCFFPSYKMLERVSERWQQTGMWGQIYSKKIVVSESRSADKTDFDEMLQQFYDMCNPASYERSVMDQNGALMLAVCRGKVSEGMDFSDDNARAVITIGIPFPNFKDIQVEQKRKYNDMHCASRGLLSGSRWYEIQAFRALNQALGRCIRHRNDWGALLMVDERFAKTPRYMQGLSKWIRPRIQCYDDFQCCLLSLADFANSRRQEPCPDESLVASPLYTPNSSNSSLIVTSQMPDRCSIDVESPSAGLRSHTQTPKKEPSVTPERRTTRPTNPTPPSASTSGDGCPNATTASPQSHSVVDLTLQRCTGVTMTPKSRHNASSAQTGIVPGAAPIPTASAVVTMPTVKRAHFVYPNVTPGSSSGPIILLLPSQPTLTMGNPVISTVPIVVAPTLTIASSSPCSVANAVPRQPQGADAVTGKPADAGDDPVVSELKGSATGAEWMRNATESVDQESINAGRSTRRSVRQTRTPSANLKEKSRAVKCAIVETNYCDGNNGLLHENTQKILCSCRDCGSVIIPDSVPSTDSSKDSSSTSSLPTTLFPDPRTLIGCPFEQMTRVLTFDGGRVAGKLGATLNAWYDEDTGGVFVPILCGGCPKARALIGYKVLQRGRSSTQIDGTSKTTSSWLFADKLDRKNKPE